MSNLTLKEIADKAEYYADTMESVEGLKSALLILAGNVRDLIPKQCKCYGSGRILTCDSRVIDCPYCVRGRERERERDDD
jgi:hypothetical protein